MVVSGGTTKALLASSAIQTGTDNYVNYLLPGILLIAIAI
jgi:hypothetical protein